MNYQRIHDAIIDRARNRTLHGYREKHHVIPRCLGGTNQNTNLVNLTAREHFIVHKLLCEIYPNESKLVYAYWMMSRRVSNLKYTRSYQVSSADYDRARQLFSKTSSINQKGKTLTDEHKRKLSIAAKTRKTRIPIKHSEETKARLSMLYKGTTRSLEIRKKISDAQRGTKRGPYVIKNKPIAVQCTYCGKIGSPRGTRRWHFENCKNKKHE